MYSLYNRQLIYFFWKTTVVKEFSHHQLRCPTISRHSRYINHFAFFSFLKWLTYLWSNGKTKICLINEVFFFYNVYVHSMQLYVLLLLIYLVTLPTLSLIHISEPTRRTPISYAVFCLKKKKK